MPTPQKWGDDRIITLDEHGLTWKIGFLGRQTGIIRFTTEEREKFFAVIRESLAVPDRSGDRPASGSDTGTNTATGTRNLPPLPLCHRNRLLPLLCRVRHHTRCRTVTRWWS
jgi:hypothetical protein